jgi:hypothetical protein
MDCNVDDDFHGEQLRAVTIVGRPRDHFRDFCDLLYTQRECLGSVKLAITAPGGGWANIYLSKNQVCDLIVTLEEQLHRVPLYRGDQS